MFFGVKTPLQADSGRFFYNPIFACVLQANHTLYFLYVVIGEPTLLSSSQVANLIGIVIITIEVENYDVR